METRYPGLTVSGTQHGYYEAAETTQVKARIRAAQADVLLVAMGAPKQELWIRQHAEETGVKVALGVGGLFDFYGGRIERAPVWMREIGMEWLFRLGKEPRRMWKRYLVGNAVFAARILLARGRGKVTAE
jgi:N-acetylglucosaminyldiphosphoundecaprenol N-acetyl-beta-D-mannosaminyltransferase